jgi:hypothetical protein
LGLVKKQVRVYNFEVAKLHTYFVGGQQQWLIHNESIDIDGSSRSSNCPLYRNNDISFKAEVHRNLRVGNGQRMDTMRVTSVRATLLDTYFHTGTGTDARARQVAQSVSTIYSRLCNAGHIAGDRFGGPGSWFSLNIVPILQDINFGEYKKFENGMFQAIEDWGAVDFFADFTYNAIDKRRTINDGFYLPTTMEVKYKVYDVQTITRFLKFDNITGNIMESSRSYRWR